MTQSLDLEAIQQSVADATRVGAQVTSPHAPELNPAQPKPADWSGAGVENGGLLLVDQGGAPVNANGGNGAGNATGNVLAQGDGDSAAQAQDTDSERELAGNVCADGGVSGGGACAAYPPQTVFVVRGGVRLPGAGLAMRP